MDDQVEAVLAEQRHHPVAVANIERHGSELPRGALEPLEIPQRVPRRAEEHAAHVVVHADDLVALAVEILDRFRANQAAASGHQDVPQLHCATPRVMQRPAEPAGFAASRFNTPAQHFGQPGSGSLWIVPLPASPAGAAGRNPAARPPARRELLPANPGSRQSRVSRRGSSIIAAQSAAGWQIKRWNAFSCWPMQRHPSDAASQMAWPAPAMVPTAT